MKRRYTRRSEYTRRNVPWELRDCALWNPIDTSQLEPGELEQFEQLQVAANEYLNMRPVKPWLALAGVSMAEFLRRLNRALLRDAHGEIIGWVGFLRGRVRLPYTRKKSTSGDSPKGLSGALQQCFKKVERLEVELKNEVLKLPAGKPHEVRVSKQTLHRVFLKKCAAAGLGKQNWPFNTRFEGRRAIDRFFDRVLVENYERALRVREGEDVASKLGTGTGFSRLLRPVHPYDLVEMDAHELHMFGSVGIEMPDGTIGYVPIERIQLLLLADARTSNILGYVAVIRRECNSDDILDAVCSATSPWRPRSLCLAVHQYDPDAGLPSMIEGLAGCGFGVLCVDNALINLAEVVFDRVVARIGCAVNWGPVRRWMRRPLVERIFCALEAAGFCRMPSSTGSHPKDPRRQQAEQKAKDFKLHFEIVLDLIDLEITRFNKLSSEGQFGLRRLEVIQQHLERAELRFMPPKLPPPDALHPDLDISVDWGWVRAKKEHPYTKFERIRYTSPKLAQDYELIDKQVVRHISRRNLRTITAYRTNGGLIDTLTAAWPWSEHDLSLEKVKQINRLIDDGRIGAQHNTDFVRDGLDYIYSEARRDACRRKAKVSRAGTSVAREQQIRDTDQRQPGTVPPPAAGPSAPRTPLVRDPHAPRIRYRM